MNATIELPPDASEEIEWKGKCLNLEVSKLDQRERISIRETPPEFTGDPCDQPLIRLKQIVQEIHQTEISGEVVKHLDEGMVVKFDHDGLFEERMFFWDELKIKGKDAPIGTLVKGRTQLLIDLPEDGYDDGSLAISISRRARLGLRHFGEDAERDLSVAISVADPSQTEAAGDLRKIQKSCRSTKNT